MKLVPYTDPILSSVLEPFDFQNPPIDPEQLALDLVKMMQDSKGIGLSANQVGLNYRVFAMDSFPETFVCFNPRIVIPGTDKVTLEEGCLSYPGLMVKVKRPKTVKVRFQSPSGEMHTKTFTGMTARVFQHELDHLDGITMLQRANGLHRESALNKWKQWKRKEHVG